MILHALTEYYHRKAESDSADIAPQGFEYVQIPFLIVIRENGDFIQLEDTSNKEGKAQSYLVPINKARTGKNSYQIANILWDHYGYILGQPDNTSVSSLESANRQHNTFVTQIDAIHEEMQNDKGVLAVKKFFKDSSNISKLHEDTNWDTCKAINRCKLTFRLEGQTELVCQSKSIQHFVKKSEQDLSDSEIGICLITGEKTALSRTHQKIKGIKKYDKKKNIYVNIRSESFISTNQDSFQSYGKEQGTGYPVSKTSDFKYATALSTLLKSNNKFLIGDMNFVCWSDKPTKKETEIPFFLDGGHTKDNPDAYVDSVQKLFSSFHHGVYDEPDAKQVIYVLGLSPNAARIVVRFWHQSTIAALSTNIAQWFHDIEMVRGHHSPYPKYMPLLRLLCNLVFEGKIENLPPNVVADATKSILEGSLLPITVLQLAIRRNRADQSVTYARASLIKAYLNRKARLTASSTFKEISVGYDKDRNDIGYVLGALFAVLEKIQEETSESGKINATIRDRYYGSASSTPVTVFGILLKLSQHHLSKIRKRNMDRSINLNKQLSEILEKIDTFPSHLNMEQQGLFAIGYYHRRQEFFNPKKNQDTAAEQNATDASSNA
ncbi:type I-C CRISPR-associated protein Cas8c/Csd1 [uncultured Psychrobacter sp.]|uniref:type I-C CRISPR-associated protein Cas8c/Csd1 n=1 Tax=uncultured Psychrobacter sp. TaxID=259303 RepID=UPI002594214F|nr:type I-C CRISPR-associated protein Cas8c/Csd1 [uncultured Psychrobacter sp.]